MGGGNFGPYSLAKYAPNSILVKRNTSPDQAHAKGFYPAMPFRKLISLRTGGYLLGIQTYS